MKRIAMPKTIQPMQPTLYGRAFSSREWLFEPKWDGFRAICFLDKGVVRFVSRNQRSLSEKFPVLQEGREDAKAMNAILDGEIVALDAIFRRVAIRTKSSCVCDCVSSIRFVVSRWSKLSGRELGGEKAYV